MSAGPTTISMQPVPLGISRAYDDLVDGLARLADSVRIGDLIGLGPSRPGSHALPVWPVPATAPTAVPAAAPSGGLAGRAEHLFASMAVEAVKTGLVALVVYQGLMMVLPAPDRPSFAPSTKGASPAAVAHLP